MTFPISSQIGVDFDAAPTSASGWTTGTVLNGSGGTSWMYVNAVTALTVGDFVGIASDYTVSAMTNAIALLGNSVQLGWAQTTFPASTYGWIALKGASGLKFRVTATTAITPGLPLYTTDGAGILSGVTNSASAFQVFGATLYTTASGATATAAAAGAATFPIIRRPA